MTTHDDHVREQMGLPPVHGWKGPGPNPELCGNLFERADQPWTYRCVMPAGHEGDCDPQLRPPPPAREEPPSAAERIAEQVFLIAMKHAGRSFTWAQVGASQKAEWIREVERAGLTGSTEFLDALDRVEAEAATVASRPVSALEARLLDLGNRRGITRHDDEFVRELGAAAREAALILGQLYSEVDNLSSEGLLRMGVGNSPVRYHAHGEVLWPVGPSGMCRACHE